MDRYELYRHRHRCDGDGDRYDRNPTDDGHDGDRNDDDRNDDDRNDDDRNDDTNDHDTISIDCAGSALTPVTGSGRTLSWMHARMKRLAIRDAASATSSAFRLMRDLSSGPAAVAGFQFTRSLWGAPAWNAGAGVSASPQIPIVAGDSGAGASSPARERSLKSVLAKPRRIGFGQMERPLPLVALYRPRYSPATPLFSVSRSRF